MSRTVLVRGFALGITRREIHDLFAAHSDVVSLRVVRTRGRPPQRRCFVRMRDAEAAERAVHALDGREYNGRVLWIDILDRQKPAWRAGDPGARNLFQSMAPENTDDHAAVTALEGPAISFVVGGRAFAHLADGLWALQPRARVAVEEARDRGGVAATYYFIDVTDDVVRDVRDALRVRSVRKDPDGRACDAAASAIESRRRAAWYLTPCPRCGGRLGPASWLTPAVSLLECDSCLWTIPT